MSVIEELANNLDRISEELGGKWIEQGSVFWLVADCLNVRQVAQTMNTCNARFVTITATQLPGNEGFRLEYLWDLGGRP